MEEKERDRERKKERKEDANEKIKLFMSFIALLDGNEMKRKIERKIKRNGERPRDKRKVIPP